MTELSAIAAAVRAGRITAADLVRESLRRIDELDPAINSVVARRDDLAIAEANAMDARIARGEDPGPLSGMPLLVKDLEDVAGMVTTAGSVSLAHSSAAVRDSRTPELLRAAGAIVVGKTNLPEFASEGWTSNLLFGTTGNPWSLGWTPGGSSGGSAAALAAGLAPLATGTDGGGSVRIPAAFCGLLGLKAS
ncbi:MAG: amidase, partial [Actinomycetes bacterium]